MLSNLYQSFSLLSQIEILLLVLVILIPAYFIGKLFWPANSDNLFLLLANRLFFGMLFLIWCVAVYVTHGKTLLLPLIILFGYGFYCNIKQPVKNKIPLDFILKCLIGFIVIWFINFLVFNPIKQNSIAIVNDDLALYSDFANYMFSNGHEAFQQFYYTHPAHNNLYHFSDLWFLGIFQNIFHINGYTVYTLIIKSVIGLLLFLCMFGFAEVFGIKSWVKYLVVVIPFLIVFPPFLDFKSVPWYLSMNYFVVPLINYNGGFFILTYLLLCLSSFSVGSPLLSIILLSLIGLINPLLIGVAPILFVLIILWIVFAPKISLLKEHYSFSSNIKFNNVIIGLVISIIVAGYAAWLTRNPESNYVQKYSTSPFAFVDVYLKYIFAALIYGLPYMIGLYYLIRHIANDTIRNLVIILFLFFQACGLFYGVFYPKIQGDIFQIQLVAWVICVVFLGSFGLLIKLENKASTSLTVALLAIMIALSVVNVATERHSTFFPVYYWNNQTVKNRISVDEVAKLNKLIDSIGSNGGYLENDITARPPQGPKYEYLYFFDPRIRTMRLNVITNDYMNEQRKQLLSQTYLSNIYGQSTDYNAGQLAEVIKDYNISWIITNKQDTSFLSMLPDFKHRTSFTYFNIYSK